MCPQRQFYTLRPAKSVSSIFRFAGVCVHMLVHPSWQAHSSLWPLHCNFFPRVASEYQMSENASGVLQGTTSSKASAWTQWGSIIPQETKPACNVLGYIINQLRSTFLFFLFCFVLFSQAVWVAHTAKQCRFGQLSKFMTNLVMSTAMVFLILPPHSIRHWTGIHHQQSVQWKTVWATWQTPKQSRVFFFHIMITFVNDHDQQSMIL